MEELINFDKFMMSEGTETLILAFTSKTGQSVEHNRYLFSFGFFCLKEHISRHFIGLISDSILKRTQDRTKRKEFLHFFIFF